VSPAGASQSMLGSFEVREVSLGKVLPGFREESLVLSPNGQHVGYVAGAVADTGFPSRDRPVFVAESKQKVHAVIDGVEGPAFDWVSVVMFSPDGRRTTYAGWLQSVVKKLLAPRTCLRMVSTQRPAPASFFVTMSPGPYSALMVAISATAPSVTS
jgi:hypothetical protein